MSNDSMKATVQANFGAHAQAYVTSASHVKGNDLARLVEAKRYFVARGVEQAAQVARVLPAAGIEAGREHIAAPVPGFFIGVAGIVAPSADGAGPGSGEIKPVRIVYGRQRCKLVAGRVHPVAEIFHQSHPGIWTDPLRLYASPDIVHHLGAQGVLVAAGPQEALVSENGLLIFLLAMQRAGVIIVQLRVRALGLTTQHVFQELPGFVRLMQLVVRNTQFGQYAYVAGLYLLVLRELGQRIRPAAGGEVALAVPLPVGGLLGREGGGQQEQKEVTDRPPGVAKNRSFQNGGKKW